MHIHPFQLAKSGSMQAHIAKDDFYMELQVQYECFENYVYTYAIKNKAKNITKYL